MYPWDEGVIEVEISDLNDKVIKDVKGLEQYSSEVIIITECGWKYTILHFQDCCESVNLEDFEGDESDLIRGTVIKADEISGEEMKILGVDDLSDEYESYTWTFYSIQTTKGHVWLRWLGTSNGYYGESVDVVKQKL